MSTSVNGVGSGIDIDSIVSSMVSASKTPKQDQIDTAKTEATTKLSAIGTLKSALDTFQSALEDLNTADSFAGLSATSSDTSKLTTTLGTDATSGTYTIETTSLATASKVSSAYITSGTTFSASTLKVSVGSGTAVSVNVAAGSSLSTIKDSLNTALKDSGVTASIISDDSGQRLVLTSTTTGSGNDITMTVTDSDGNSGSSLTDSNLAKLSIDPTAKATSTTGGYVIQSANADYTIDGLTMSSASNTIDSAIEGLSFTLVDTGKSTLTVDTNTDGLKTTVQSFVDAYNSLVTSIKSLTSVTTSTDDDGTTTTTAASLTSDATTRTILSTLRNQLVGSSTNGGTISILSQLGVSTQTDGTLEIDDDKLTTALEKNASSVTGFFTGTGGLLTRMSDSLDVYTQTNGLLDQREDSLNDTLTNLADQQDTLDRRMDKLETTLYAKYNAMDTLVAQLNATSSSVLTTLDALNNSSDD
ncbi:flagellar filament capping protein FliD [Pseudomonas typographi]|uniref:flagellar filament capping protein FliD n=1 Tax=Pseudomonas typographi TaxID=2715964 RepID=UPI001685C251|nr:flagellar filament capping protein FliD [Pseudomonas typographi]MBD1550671.1 flagellar filament capping protein FliD [Pseudomonas typographi]